MQKFRLPLMPLLSLPLMLLFTLNTQAKVYTFSAVEGALFENPANWYPTYPGTQLQEGDQWVIEDEMFLSAEELRIEGELQIGMQGALVATEFHQRMHISPTGRIDNGGRLIAGVLHLEGELFNRRSSQMSIDQLQVFSSGLAQNFGQLHLIGHFSNEGRFDNYASCTVLGDFRNLASFHQVRQARLVVSGELFFQPGCVLTQSQESEIYVGRTEKVAIHDKLAAIFR